MSDANQAQTAEWLRAAPSVRGTLARGIRFADGSFVLDGDSGDFAAATLETAWRMATDTFAVLRAQHLPPARLTWVYEHAVFHCVQRADSAILGAFVTRKTTETDSAGLERLLAEFQLPLSPAP